MAEPTLWIDVDDLVHYLVHHDRPSGIQRVTFEICKALQAQDNGAGRVRFVRRGAGPRDLITVTWKRLDAAFALVSNPKPIPAALPDSILGTPPPPPSIPIPEGAGPILRQALALQVGVLLALVRVPVLACADIIRRFRVRRARRAAAYRIDSQRRQRAGVEQSMLEGVPMQQVTAPGDTFLVLGSPWVHRDYAQTVRWARDERRMRFALLIHDLIPVRRPEWCDRGVVTTFTEWHKSVLPLADQIFTNSRATAADVVAWAGQIGLVTENPVQPVPMGTGLNHAQNPGAAEADPPAAHLPAPGSYVLFVSTIEARKNHALLFRVWRRLLTEMPPDQVPVLVFAGRVGWMVSDLMQQLENAAWLGGKIRLVSNPTDTELMALYRGCQFTVFPSLFEGWGLPVSESLALGRPCIVSNRTALPEAGGDLARYFDPENLDEACQTIRAVIEDPAGLEAWRNRVAREFQQVPWSDSATVIRRALAGLEPGPMEKLEPDMKSRS